MLNYKAMFLLFNKSTVGFFQSLRVILFNKYISCFFSLVIISLTAQLDYCQTYTCWYYYPQNVISYRSLYRKVFDKTQLCIFTHQGT